MEVDKLEALLKYMELLSRNNQFGDNNIYKRMNRVADEIEKELEIVEVKCRNGNGQTLIN